MSKGNLSLHFSKGIFKDLNGNPSEAFTKTISIGKFDLIPPPKPQLVSPASEITVNTNQTFHLTVRAQKGTTIYVLHNGWQDPIASAKGQGDQNVDIPLNLDNVKETDLLVTAADANGNVSLPVFVPPIHSDTTPPKQPTYVKVNVVSGNQVIITGQGEAGTRVHIKLLDFKKTLSDGTIVKSSNDVIEQTFYPIASKVKPIPGTVYKEIEGTVKADGSFSVPIDITPFHSGRIYGVVWLTDEVGNFSDGPEISFEKSET